MKQLPVPEPLLLDQRIAGQTFLSKYASCPRDAYLYRMFPRQTHAMMRGIAFHGGVEEATRFMVENGEERIPGEAARDFAEGYLTDHPELVLPEAERDALRLMAWNWGEATVLDLEYLVGTEVEVKMEVAGWLLRCRIDLVYRYPDHVAIRDYKTALALPTDEEVQQSFQGKFYSLACLEGTPGDGGPPLGAGLNETNFDLVFPRYRDEEYGNLFVRGAAFDRKDLQDFKMTLVDLLARVERSYETQDWLAVDGSHCSTCAAQALCPIKPDVKDMPPVDTLTEAREAASELYALDRQKTRLQKAVRGWVANNGPLHFGTDLAYDIKATESNSVPSWSALEHGIRRAVEFGEPFDLSLYRKTSHGTRFVKRKQTDDEKGNM